MNKLTLVQRSIFDICIFGTVLLLNILALIINENSVIFQVASTGISALALAISIWLLFSKKELSDEATYETFSFGAKITLVYILISLLLVAIMLVFVPPIVMSYKVIYIYITMILIVFNAAVIRSETRGTKRGFCDE